MVDQIIVRYEENSSRSAAYDSEKEIGKCTYTVDSDNWIIEHTEVDKAYGGRGLARRLVDAVADAAREKHIKIIPKCEYAAGLFQRDHKYDDINADLF